MREPRPRGIVNLLHGAFIPFGLQVRKYVPDVDPPQELAAVIPTAAATAAAAPAAVMEGAPMTPETKHAEEAGAA